MAAIAAASGTAAHDISITSLITDGKNPRGIPSAKFIDDVDVFLRGTSVEAALGAYNELYSKYKYMESSFEKSKAIYKSKIPDIEQTLEAIKMMKTKQENSEEFFANYSLCDTIYTRAKVDTECEKVYLWIGANTMVSTLP